jgi:RecA-family ATPase
MSAEDSPEATVKPRLEAVGADLERVFLLSMRRDGFEGDLLFPDDIAALTDAVAEKRPELVTIDPLMAHVGASVDSYKDHSVRRMLVPFARIALEFRCAVLIVLHLNKGGGTEVLQRLGGSVGFMGAARSVLLLGRDPEDPDGKSGSRRVLAHAKSNVSAVRPSAVYEIQAHIVEATDDQPAVLTARLVWLDESDYEADELLDPAPSPEAETSRLNEAKRFLREFLSDGPRLSQDVKQAADEAGISQKTLRRAREQLGIVIRQVGFPAMTEWELPESDPDADG